MDHVAGDPDPAAALAPLIDDALSERDDLTIVASVCGTDADPQGLGEQRSELGSAGALVTGNAAHAGRLAVAAAGSA